MVEANVRYVQGYKEALSIMVESMKALVEFYPRHIEKEDKHFFIPCMDYFNEAEQDAMLREEHEFDRNFIHEKYKGIVATAEKLLVSHTL